MHSYIVLLFNKARALPHQNFRKPIRSERQAIRRQRPTTSSVLTNAHSMPETSKAKKRTYSLVHTVKNEENSTMHSEFLPKNVTPFSS